MRERYNVTGKEINVVSSQYLWRAGKYECCYRKNCDGQRNTCVTITKIMTDPSCYLDHCDGINAVIVTIGDGKACVNVAIVTQWSLCDGQLTGTFYCTTYCFPNLFLTFYVFLSATLLEKGPEMRHFAAKYHIDQCYIHIRHKMVAIVTLLLSLHSKITFLHPLKIWNEIKHPLIPKFQRWNRQSLGMDKQLYLTLYWAHYYIAMLGLKLVHDNKKGPFSLSTA